MRRRSTTLTEQELEIMKIVWERDRSTVRDVYEALLERRKVAYTTVMTMMKILEQKKYLKKILVDRAYVYRPPNRKGR
jgi:predicted transcriptional regulator